MHVSNFRPVKRVPDIIRAFAKIVPQVPAVLVLAGDGPQRPEVEAEVERLGLGERVRFLGKVDAVAELLRSADLFLLPSASESFGLSALEAMACGVPVVGTEVGGLREVVRNGETGALVPVGDVDALAARSIELLTDGRRWAAARAAAIRRAEGFSAERVVPMYEDLYRRVLAG
jgi:N-acetyl-alpha-D-glucosaminyl L-malate synthase BshA